VKFHVLTLFPAMFDGPLAEGVVGRAISGGIVAVERHDFRRFATDRHGSVDDYPFGGGPGMVLKPEPLFAAVDDLKGRGDLDETTPIILLTPQGRVFDQTVAEDLARAGRVALICGRYEGVDERIRKDLATDEISIGDYVLSGGELAAMVVIDAVARLVPGVVGSAGATDDDSHTSGLLQFPQYTRPASFRGLEVPETLLSGDHARIAAWRRREALRRTARRRPDLLQSADLSEDDRRALDEPQEPG
jgi:tRNA (guanine37-N1)-methyltransferase